MSQGDKRGQLPRTRQESGQMLRTSAGLYTWMSDLPRAINQRAADFLPAYSNLAVPQLQVSVRVYDTTKDV